MNWLKRMQKALASKNEKMGRPMTAEGAEIHDPTPVAPPIGYNPSLSFEERIRVAIRSEQLAHALETSGRESYKDFNDYGDEESDDEIFPASRFEQVAMDAQRLGREYARSKAERDRLDNAENRLAEKIGKAVQTNREYEEYEEDQRPRPPSRRRPLKSAGEAPRPPSDPDAD